MKLPVAVRASDGSKYFTPDSGPIAFQLPRVLRVEPDHAQHGRADECRRSPARPAT